MTTTLFVEVTDIQAETLNGGSVASDLKTFYFNQINNLQINEGNGVQNNFVFNFGNKRPKK